MLFRLAFALAVVWSVLLVGCSGGSGAAEAGNFTCAGDDLQVLCLTSCNLGCSDVDCLRTDIAQNEILILQFSSDVDPMTVNSSTIRLRTASGAPPVGEFFVNGNQIEFVPTLLVSGGQTFFGFRPGETYSLTIPGGKGESEVLRSTSGKPFQALFTCSLVSNQGIQDLNGVPPAAKLVSPGIDQLDAAPVDTIIQLEFNEMVDITPFLSGSPVTFRTRGAFLGPNGLECDGNSSIVDLSGSPRLDFDSARGVSVLSLRPQGGLSGGACVEIHVTGQVVDLAGKPAQPQTFRFFTEVLPLAEADIVEEFDDDVFIDRDRSGGVWSGGVATFAAIGGDGRHGTFTPEIGVDLGLIDGLQTYEIDTDAVVIPAENTRTGSPIVLSNGRFFFDEFVLPADTRLRFVGSMPPIITVAGRLEVLGEIDVRGESLAYAPAVVTGQAGGAGGVFGGAGGKGGNQCSGEVVAGAQHQGGNGESANVLGGRAYASSASSAGGRGSTVFPVSGLDSALFYGTPEPSGQCSVAFSPSACAGGGGGGLRVVGEPGLVVSNNHVDPVLGVPPRLDVMGPAAAGGTAVTFFPFPPASGSVLSSVHFVVGGAGGGGAASNAALSVNANPGWVSGCGGGGGGGALALRAGDVLVVGLQAGVLCAGGSAGALAPSGGLLQPAPGGGGSGGSVVLQSGRLADVLGVIDVRGGAGGVYDRAQGCSPPIGAHVRITGGAGSPGFVRLETPVAPTPAALASMQPAAAAENVAELTERDDFVSLRSTWYSTGLALAPDFVRYEIHATVDGTALVFSDDPAVSTLAAGPGAAVRLWIQAGQLDLVTGEVQSMGPWRVGVRTSQAVTGITSDERNGFRWVIAQDRAIAQEVVLDRVTVTFLQ